MLLVLRQIWAVVKINLLSLTQRVWMSLSASIAIGLVVFVLLGALALENGFRQTLNNSGSPDIAVVLRAGSESELNSVLLHEQQNLIAAGPGIAEIEGKVLVSPEMYVVVDSLKKSTQTKASLSLRGIVPAALAARHGIGIVGGRMFAPGSNELVVGRRIADEFEGYSLGSTVRLRNVEWRVVGIFEAAGSVFESEIWADLHVVQSLFNRGNVVQAMRVRLKTPDSIEALKNYSKSEIRLNIDIKSEQEFYADQAKVSSDLINYIGKPLALIMALGALAAALNAMYASVAGRAREIATLRVIGFGRLAVFAGTLAESFVLALIGALIGAVLAYLTFNNFSVSTMGGNMSQLVFTMQLSTSQLVQGTAWSCVLGFLGGLFPAVRAARQPLTIALGE
ncbi:MAG: ABC transporter permease [Pseudomonadota bacterium]